MGQSWYIIFIPVLLNFRGFVRGTSVEGFVGDSAVLPCSIPESEVQDEIEKFRVQWRDDEGKNVCDINGGNRIVEEQDPKYKNRVKTFPEEYKKGNFSIKLNGLQLTDTRKYHCYITRSITPQDTFQKEVITMLNVKEKPGGRGNCGEPSSSLLLLSFLLTGILLFI